MLHVGQEGHHRRASALDLLHVDLLKTIEENGEALPEEDHLPQPLFGEVLRRQHDLLLVSESALVEVHESMQRIRKLYGVVRWRGKRT